MPADLRPAVHRGRKDHWMRDLSEPPHRVDPISAWASLVVTPTARLTAAGRRLPDHGITDSRRGRIGKAAHAQARRAATAAVTGPETLDQDMTPRDIAEALARLRFYDRLQVIAIDREARNYLLASVRARIGERR